MYRLQKIDELYLPLYKYLTGEDECYFFMNYTPPVSENKTPENSIIMNYKKKMDRRDQKDWKWKGIEIQKVSTLFIQNASSIIEPDAILVPVPPSKMKGHDLYDDRNIQLVKNYCAAHPGTEFRELVTVNADMPATHEVEKTPQELMEFLTVDETLCNNPKGQIVIVDDVLRHGAHFNAIKALLRPRFPNARFTGLFIARTQH